MQQMLKIKLKAKTEYIYSLMLNIINESYNEANENQVINQPFGSASLAI